MKFPPNTLAYGYIRCSTEEQKKGDSSRRQTQLIKDFVRKHNLILDTQYDLADLGVSGFEEKNLKSGKLGDWIRAVEKGLVPKGSVLLIENWDRFSRASLPRVRHTMYGIIFEGVNIVTLEPETLFNEAEAGELGADFVAGIQIKNANLESEKKRNRLNKKWAEKYEGAERDGIVISAMCPKWLIGTKGDVHTGKRGGFKVREEAASTINWIFDLKIQGLSMFAIEQKLNSEPCWVPHPTRRTQKSVRWRRTYIRKLLTNRAVIGEFVPGMRSKQKGLGQFKAIKNYYPAIVEEGKFFKVQEQFERQEKSVSKGKGRAAKCSSLFRDLAWCPYCGSHMYLVNKGSKREGLRELKYMVCDAHQAPVQKKGKTGKCSKGVTPYDEFERAVIEGLVSLKPEEVLPNAEEQGHLVRRLESHAATLRAKIADNQSQIENFTKAVGNAKKPETIERFVGLIESLELEGEELSKEVDGVVREIAKASTNKKTFSEWQDGMSALWAELDEGDVEIRQRTKEHLAKIIDRIEIYGHGDHQAAEHMEALVEEYLPDLRSSPHYDGFRKYVEMRTQSRSGRFYRVFVKRPRPPSIETADAKALSRQEVLRRGVAKRASKRTGGGFDVAPADSLANRQTVTKGENGQRSIGWSGSGLLVLIDEYFDGRSEAYKPLKSKLRLVCGG